MLLSAPGRARLAAAAGLVASLSPGAVQAERRMMWHALPVAGGTDALAAVAHLEPGLPAWRVFYESVRRSHGLWGEESGGASVSPGSGSGGGVVPLPLAPDTWRRILDRDALPDEQLAVAILGDRRASLLYRGLAALDEPTLEALAADLPAVRAIYERHADAFAAFAARFEVRDGAVALPGGPGGAQAWEALVGASPGEPARFLEKLLAANGGRRAFLFDSLARLDPARRRFALGAGAAEGRASEAALHAMVAVFDRERAWWRGENGAFARPDADAARLLRELRVGADGTLSGPSGSRAFWRAVFEGSRPGSARAWIAEVRASPTADGAWLAGQVGAAGPGPRRLRFEQVTFGQRVFGEVSEEALPAVVEALQGLRDARALVLALERMGTRDADLYAAGAAAARRASSASGRAGLRAQGALQGALGVIDRARFARTIDVAGAEELARTLFAASGGEGRALDRAIAGWVEATLLPALARGVYGGREPGDPETTVLRAMAGDRLEGRERLAPFEWEGLWYRADPGRAEFARLERVRAHQEGQGLGDAVRSCLSVAVARDAPPCGLAPVLTSLVYAAHVGDPDGPALAGEDVSGRHDFGRAPWELPEEVAGPGVPWHVRGSLLGLERALARLQLRRLSADELPEAPPVVGADLQRWLAVPVALANPRELSDEDRDALVAAIESGRSRVASQQAGGADVAAAGRDAGLEPWRARAFAWMLEHETPARASFFSLGELLRLGAPADRRWDAWGVSAELERGLLPRLPDPRPLDESAGRQPEPAVAERFVDVSLRVAEHLADRRLPASLAPAVASALLPDLFAEARPLALDDRHGLDAWVRTLAPERLDDAVASLAGRGPLQPAARPGGTK